MSAHGKKKSLKHIVDLLSMKDLDTVSIDKVEIKEKANTSQTMWHRGRKELKTIPPR